MLYIERQPSKWSYLLLALLSALMIIGALMVTPLRVDEAYQAAVARDMVETGEYFLTKLYGRRVYCCPMYPWLSILCSGFKGPCSDFLLRLPAVLSLVGLSVLAGRVATWIQSSYAGWIASAVVLTSGIGFNAGITAEPGILQALFLGLAWFFWYLLGRRFSFWWGAWCVSHLFVFMAVVSVGSQALFWFYVPLLFLRRPVHAFLRMQLLDHLLSLVGLCLLLVFWVALMDQPFMPWGMTTVSVPTVSEVSFWKHWLFFPCLGLIALGGWGLLGWAPGCGSLRWQPRRGLLGCDPDCESLRIFEKNSSACLYCRTIVVSIGALMWLWPKTKVSSLILLLGPMAVLIGVYFEIVLRRYQNEMKRLLTLVSWLIVLFGVCLLLFWLGHACGMITISTQLPDGVQRWLPWGVCGLLAVVVVLQWILILRSRSRLTFRSCIIWCILGVRVMLLCSLMAFGSWKASERRLSGEILGGGVQSSESAQILEEYGTNSGVEPRKEDWSEAKTVYYLRWEDFDYVCLTEMFYVGKRVVLLQDLSGVQKLKEDVVYVLSSRLPALAEREWMAVSPGADMNRKNRVEWKWSSTKPYLSLTRKKANQKVRELTLYRGKLK